MAELLVICPTVRRPANVRRLKGSYTETSTAVSELVFDQRDLTCTEKVNDMARKHMDAYEALMFVGDDHIFQTWGWDDLLMAPLRERPGISFPDDCSRPGHPEVFAISSSIVRALGWMMLPSQKHYYVDDAVLQLGVRARCITYLPEVVLPHLHYKVVGGQPDEIYARAHSWLDEDRASYWEWLAERSEGDVETVTRVVC